MSFSSYISNIYFQFACQVLILLDFKADKSLQDEGLAREIVNRVQKLRKKSQLLPSDLITVYHDIKQLDCELYNIAKSHTEFIENSLKMPFKPASQIPKGATVIAEEIQQVCFTYFPLHLLPFICINVLNCYIILVAERHRAENYIG